MIIAVSVVGWAVLGAALVEARDAQKLMAATGGPPWQKGRSKALWMRRPAPIRRSYARIWLACLGLRIMISAGLGFAAVTLFHWSSWAAFGIGLAGDAAFDRLFGAKPLVEEHGPKKDPSDEEPLSVSN